MSIIYKIIQRINPRKPQDPKKFYAKAVRKDKIKIKQLAENVATRTLANPVDVQAVILAVVNEIKIELRNGNAVELGDLGVFSSSIASEGAETEEKFVQSMIKKVRINYRPGSELTGVVKSLSFEKQAKV